MKRSCACAATAANASSSATNDATGRLPWQFSFQKAGGLGRGRVLEETVGRRALDQPALVQEQDLVAEAVRLPEVVRAPSRSWCRPRACAAMIVLDLVRRARVEARRRLVEEQHFRAQRPRARQREPLLLAAGEHARRVVRAARRARPCAAPRSARSLALAATGRRPASAHTSRCRAPSAAAAPAAGTPSPAAAARPAISGAFHAIASRGRREQAVAEPQQHALARAVRPEDHRARPGVERQSRCRR